MKKIILGMMVLITATQWLSADSGALLGLTIPGLDGNKTAQAKLKQVRLMNAPIDDSRLMGRKEMKRFIHMIKMDSNMYGKAYPAMKIGFAKAAKAVKNSDMISYEVYLKKAIELSGKKEMLDRNAQTYGYHDAFDQTIQAQRIIRALLGIAIQKKMQKVPDNMKPLVQKMLKTMAPETNQEDMDYVKPYMGFLKKLKIK